jgi:hypothetical protein
MTAITWKPGTNTELDTLFDQLREKQYHDHSHRLWENYSKDHFQSVIAYTINFDTNNEPDFCSTISSKDCWPSGVYRILNRTWKPAEREAWLREIRPHVGDVVNSQTDWLKENTNCKLFFISRQTPGWQRFCIRSFDKLNINFKSDKYRYITCDNCEDDVCWQSIIYNGDEKILDNWKRKNG